MASSGASRWELTQDRSSWVRVREATYLVIGFILAAYGSPARPGQAAAMPCHLHRPEMSASLASNDLVDGRTHHVTSK